MQYSPRSYGSPMGSPRQVGSFRFQGLLPPQEAANISEQQVLEYVLTNVTTGVLNSIIPREGIKGIKDSNDVIALVLALAKEQDKELAFSMVRWLVLVLERKYSYGEKFLSSQFAASFIPLKSEYPQMSNYIDMVIEKINPYRVAPVQPQPQQPLLREQNIMASPVGLGGSPPPQLMGLAPLTPVRNPFDPQAVAASTVQLPLGNTTTQLGSPAPTLPLPGFGGRSPSQTMSSSNQEVSSPNFTRLGSPRQLPATNFSSSQVGTLPFIGSNAPSPMQSPRPNYFNPPGPASPGTIAVATAPNPEQPPVPRKGGRVWGSGYWFGEGTPKLFKEEPKYLQFAALEDKTYLLLDQEGKISSPILDWTGGPPQGLPRIQQISGIRSRALLLDENGTVWISELESRVSSPGRAVYYFKLDRIQGLPRVTQVAVGYEHNLILDANGGVWSFGPGVGGRLGHGDEVDRNKPTQIPGLPRIIEISAGFWHNLILDANGGVWSFGPGDGGRLGHGDQVNRNKPTQIPGLPRIIEISAGSWHSLLLDENGNVWSFGSGDGGRLGHGDEVDRNKPTQIPGLPRVTKISGGSWHSLLLDENGSVWSFGSGVGGRLGFGDNNNRLKPTKIEGLPRMQNIFAGHYQSAFIDYGLDEVQPSSPRRASSPLPAPTLPLPGPQPGLGFVRPSQQLPGLGGSFGPSRPAPTLPLPGPQPGLGFVRPSQQLAGLGGSIGPSRPAPTLPFIGSNPPSPMQSPRATSPVPIAVAGSPRQNYNPDPFLPQSNPSTLSMIRRIAEADLGGSFGGF